MISSAQSWFAVVPPGLEEVAREELSAIGVRATTDHGGVAFGGGIDALYRVHLHGRVPSRVWARVGQARGVRSLDGLAAAVRAMPWSDFVWPRQPVEVQVAAHQVRWGRRDAMADKVALAVRDALRVPRKEGRRPPREGATILVRMEGSELEASIDASGDLLHRRGWRRDTSEAPLRENLAAAVLWLADWEPGEPLVDPMCGSGTFPIEAATIAQRRAPGEQRSFAFERWPSFDAASWARLRAEPREEAVRTVIIGGDRDEAAVRAARVNATRAGVDRAVDLRHSDVSELRLPDGPPGLVVVNPPYGERIRGANASWAALGKWLGARAQGWRVAVVCPDPALLRHLGLSVEAAASFSNGGIRVGVYLGEVAPAP